MTYLGLKAVTGVFLDSSLYFVVILLAAILDFGSSKTSAILETGRLQVSDVLGITRPPFEHGFCISFMYCQSLITHIFQCYFCLRLGVETKHYDLSF